MSYKKIFIAASILIVSAIALFIYPSINQPISAEQSKFSGHENHLITLTEAVGLTKAFQITTSSNEVLAHYFGSDALEKALAQPGCVGLRMYYGKHQDGSPALVIVGVDKKGKDITSGTLLQRSLPCPPECVSGDSELQQGNLFANLK
jgi:hypothetical protein